MKRYLLLLPLLCALALAQPPTTGYNARQDTTFSATGTATRIVESSTILYHQLFWTKSGTVTTCSVTLDSSADNSAWSAGGIIGAQTCTSNGNSAITAGNANYIRINLGTLTGGGTISFTYIGWTYNPSPTSVNPTSGVIPYNNAGTLGDSPCSVSGNVVTCTPTAATDGYIGIPGKTSGTATFTAPDVAGTSTNGVTMTNVLLGPNGTGTAPTYSFSNQSGIGMGRSSSNSGTVFFGSGLGFSLSVANGPTISNNFALLWAAGSVDQGQTATIDTSINRVAAGIVGTGKTNSAPSSTGNFAASGFQSRGTRFTTNNGCGETTNLVGGGTAGTIHTSGSTGCTTIVTLGDTSTSINGWACFAHDLTTAADYFHPSTSSNTTTVTIVTGTIVSGDTIEFGCIGY